MFSIVMPWSNRAQLRDTLKANRAIFEKHDVEVIIINCGGHAGELIRHIADAATATAHVLHLPNSSFNKCVCQNIGTVVSSRPYLFLLDVDIVLDTDFLDEAEEQLSTGEVFATMKSIAASSPPRPARDHEPDWSFAREIIKTRELITRDHRRAVIRTRTGPGLRLGDGLVLLRRADMIAVQGMNSLLEGWGFEDTDLQIRLQIQLGLRRVEIGTATHIDHPRPASRSKYRENVATATHNYSRGNFLGTLNSDSERWLSRLVRIQ